MQECGFDAEFAREIRQRLGLSLTQMAELTWRVPLAVSYSESGTTKMPRTVRSRLLAVMIRHEGLGEPVLPVLRRAGR